MVVFQNFYFKIAQITPLPHLVYKQKDGGYKLIDIETIESLSE
jgi:hypothetical protein